MNRMNDIIEKSKILVVASQSKEVLKKLCNKIVSLQDGVIINEE